MAWCLAAVACGGRYDASSGSGGAGASANAPATSTGATNTGATNTGATSTGATSTGATSAGVSTTGAAGNGINLGTAGNPTMVGVGGSTTPVPPDPSIPCAMADLPPPPQGPFAAPPVVWTRVAMLTWGKPVPPAGPLPPAASYPWARGLVQPALNDAMLRLGSAPGVETYLRQAFGLDPAAPFQMRWAVQVPTAGSLPALLLTAPLGEPGRVGIVTEPSWLALHRDISSRGSAIDGSLLALQVPPPPANVPNLPLDPSLTDRAALDVALANPACKACHTLVDPPGYALGHFAADGSYRELDHGQPIDVSGSFRTMNGQGSVPFNGLEDFGRQALGTCDATFGVADSFLRAALVINGAPEVSRDELFRISQGFVRQGFVVGGRSYAALVSAYIQSPAGLYP